MRLIPASPGKTFGFGLRAMGRYWELLPLVSILSAASVGAISFMGWSLYQKPDVWLRRSEGIPPWENVNKTGPMNFKEYIIGRRHVTNAEIEKLRAEIGSYKAK